MTLDEAHEWYWSTWYDIWTEQRQPVKWLQVAAYHTYDVNIRFTEQKEGTTHDHQ